jgi:hypothetical protein
MVGVVGAGVVLEDVQRIRPDLAVAAPVESAEIHEQVGGDSVGFGVEVLGPVGDRQEQAIPVVTERLELRLDAL